MNKLLYVVVLAISLIQLPIYAKASQTSPVEVIQRYNQLRQSGDYVNASKLLIKYGFHSGNPIDELKDLNKIKQLPPNLKNHDKIWAFIQFMADFDKSSGFNFRIMGLKSGTSDHVLINAISSNNSIVIPLEIVTTQYHGSYFLDYEKSVSIIAPEAVAKADQLSCISNLKLLSLSLMQYAQDHNDKFPVGNQWINQLMPYVQSERLFHCPSDSANKKWSYALNKNLTNTSLGNIQSPADTVLLFETSSEKKNQCDNGSSLCNPARHARGNVYAFCDGHVEVLKTKPNGKHSWKP